jgi:hypothetical protein
LNPIHTEQKSDKLAFPFNIREGMAAWRALYFKPGEFQPDPSKPAQINRGAYLAWRIAANATRHAISLKPMKAAPLWKARPSKVGTLPTSPRIGLKGSEAGPMTNSCPISRKGSRRDMGLR